MAQRKLCSKCGTEQPLDLFHNNHKNPDGKHYHCKPCRKGESLKQYGMTLEDYDNLLAEQGGVCAICGTDDPRGTSTMGRFYVDHNHETGCVRGLLCNTCNTGIGQFRDKPEALLEAYKYLMERGNYGN